MSSVILCVVLSIMAATAVLTEAAAIQPEDDPAPNTGVDGGSAVVTDGPAAGPQARFGFCLDDWLSFNGKCFHLANYPDNWRNAERFCANFGGSLASVHSIWEYNFLQRMVRTGGHAFAWIGGFYFQDEWRWEDGSVFDYHNWEAAASTDSYQCLQLNSQGSQGWSNHGCSMSFPFVCQVKPNCF